MFLKTITLKGTRHQIVLGYESRDSMMDAMRKALSDHDGNIMLIDDFGQTAYYTRTSLVSVVETDLGPYQEFLVQHKIADVKAENSYQKALGADPTLSFLVGGQNPGFLRRR